MNKLGNLFVLTTCFAALGFASIAGAQTVRHDKMDARAARADIRRLQMDRRMALRHHDWGKVKQDDRLIRADQHWIHKDVRKVERAG